MAYTDDWESLMNGVFGPGGKLKFSQSTPQAAQPKPEKPEKTQDSPLPDWNAALLARQKKLDEMLKQQNAALKGQDAATKSALEDSRKMLRDMEEDGLLAKGTADAKPEHLGSFEGLADEVKKTVLGQDAFVEGVARAMRRPFVLGTEPPAARNVVLLCGGAGTGRHFALTETARCMAARGLLQSNQIASLDLAQGVLAGGAPASRLHIQRSAEEERLICRAKAVLMEVNLMSEAEAHRFLQKYSMDTGLRLAETARLILGRYTTG